MAELFAGNFCDGGILIMEVRRLKARVTAAIAP
jgi:hypothetical protein